MFYWANFNQMWHKASSRVKGTQVCSNEFPCHFPIKDHSIPKKDIE